MAGGRPWFLVMTADDANRPGSSWVRLGAVSRGKVAVRPIAPEGWLTVIVFVLALVGAEIAVWAGAFRSGALSLPSAIVATILIAVIVIAGFIWAVRARMTRLD
jgi:hypothetical protein